MARCRKDLNEVEILWRLLSINACIFQRVFQVPLAVSNHESEIDDVSNLTAGVPAGIHLGPFEIGLGSFPGWFPLVLFCQARGA
jgi:hypothetical protein